MFEPSIAGLNELSIRENAVSSPTAGGHDFALDLGIAESEIRNPLAPIHHVLVIQP